MDEANLRLDHNHMIAAIVVDEIDERAEKRGLAAHRLAGHDHQAVGLGAKALDFRGQPQLLRRNHSRRNHAEDDAGPSMIVEGEMADAADLRHIQQPLDGLDGGVIVDRADRVDEQRDVGGRKNRFLFERTDLTVHPDHRPRLRHDVDDRCAAVGCETEDADHRLESTVGMVATSAGSARIRLIGTMVARGLSTR